VRQLRFGNLPDLAGSCCGRHKSFPAAIMQMTTVHRKQLLFGTQGHHSMPADLLDTRPHMPGNALPKCFSSQDKACSQLGLIV
jgi:hypothetical protein